MQRLSVYQKIVLLFLLLFLWELTPFEKGKHFFSSYQGQSHVHGMLNRFFYTEEELDFLDYQISNVLLENDFNGNVLIARYGMIIYERSFGFACFNRREPLDIHTAFQLASISKTFTAAAVLLMEQKGLIGVDDTLATHIPEFPYPNITIRQLLTHTSGLQNYMWLVERFWNQKRLPDNEDILQLFLDRPRPLNFTPGERFDYSNTGYVFLGLLIERVSGMRFAEFIHQHIFVPLEMHDSFVYDLHHPQPVDNRAYGFRQWRGRHILIPDDELDGPLGDKGIFSTVHDLYKWDQALHNAKILPGAIWQTAFEPGRLNNDSLVNYGFGWRLQTYLDKKIVHHPGRWHGFRTSMKRFTDDYTTLILLSNNNQSIARVIEDIQDILYYDEKEIWMAQRAEMLLDSLQMFLPEVFEEFEE